MKLTRKTFKASKVHAREIDFELHTLGWRDFQNLCITILGEVMGQSVQSFCATNDAGRDGAFRGIWVPTRQMPLTGSFVVQSKFSAKPGKHLRLSDVSDELEKAERLAAAGLADNYILMTNCQLSARSDAEIRAAFEDLLGIEHCLVLGQEAVTRYIVENKRLRMLVPRVYGLGDLSQILDERAYRQAHEILTTLKGELVKFVITHAFRKSVRALNRHSFVLLLGEPACGKSTIASALALASADRWGCQVVKVRDAAHFEEHWNPDEPEQFFWVDDALGQTQYERDRALAWNREFSHMETALKLGARVVFTSRDYIYREALAELKESAFPLLRESQVVIEVEKLSIQEKEQILYNHVRLGDQPAKFKTAIKPFLPQVAAHSKFLPEIARRLGSKLLTRNLDIYESQIMDFVQNPQEWLCDVIKTLDEPTQAALALVFMNAGKLQSPLRLTTEEERALTLLNATPGTARKALTAQDGTLVVLGMERGKHWWSFKHPTVRDAFGILIAKERELMDIYLAGTPVEALVEEITCGKVEFSGVKVVVPENLFGKVVQRLSEIPWGSVDERRMLGGFLERRCNRKFMELYLQKHPHFIARLTVHSWLAYVPDVRVIARLHELKLLPEKKRQEFIGRATRLAVETPDADFLQNPKLRALFRPIELRAVLRRVREELLPQLDGMIKEWTERFERDDEDDDPDNHFWTLRDSFKAYQKAFNGNLRVAKRFDRALTRIDQKVEELRKREDKSSSDEIASTETADDEVKSERSVFDDVDA